MDDDAASFFGPPTSPYYDAAAAIQSDKPIGGASLAAIGPDIDRRFQEGDFLVRLKDHSSAPTCAPHP